MVVANLASPQMRYMILHCGRRDNLMFRQQESALHRSIASARPAASTARRRRRAALVGCDHNPSSSHLVRMSGLIVRGEISDGTGLVKFTMIFSSKVTISRNTDTRVGRPVPVARENIEFRLD